MKRIFWIVSAGLVILFAIAMTAVASTENAHFEIETEPSETVVEEKPEEEETIVVDDYVLSDFSQTVPASLEEAEKAKDEAIERQETAEKLMECLVNLNYELDHPAMKLAQAEIERAAAAIEYYEACRIELVWRAKAEQYPVATQVWRYMSETLGWNDYVCAGVMGNMMAECGGHTLDLHWNSYNSTSHYGLCQWSKKYFPHMQGASVEEQLIFLGCSVPATFDSWAGKAYKYTYESFLQITNCQEAARAFSNVYERPGTFDTRREKLALKAFEYFTND